MLPGSSDSDTVVLSNAVYELRDNHILYLNGDRLRQNTQDYQVISDGSLLWLGTSGTFLKRTVNSNTWNTLAGGITQFGVNDNGLRYTLNEDHFLAINEGSGWANVDDFSIAPDGKLHILNQSGWFGRRLPGEGTWTQVITAGITKFSVTDKGTSYALSDTDVLSVNGEAAWAGTQDFTVTHDGTLYWLGNSGIYQAKANRTWTTLVESGITKIDMATDGTSYGLNESTHQLYRGETPTYRNTEDFALARSGKLYWLSVNGWLQYQKESGGWANAGRHIDSFVLDTEGPVATTLQTVISGTLTGASTQASGPLTLGGETIALSAVASGYTDGLRGNTVRNLKIFYGASVATTFYTGALNTLNISVTQAEGVADLDDLIAAINTGSDFYATLGTANGAILIESSDAANAIFDLQGGQNALAATLYIAMAIDENDYRSTTASLAVDSSLSNNTAAASYNTVTDTIEVAYHGAVPLYKVDSALRNLDEVDRVVSLPSTLIGNSLRSGFPVLTQFSIAGTLNSDVNNVTSHLSNNTWTIPLVAETTDATQAAIDVTGLSLFAQQGVLSGSVTAAAALASGDFLIGGETITLAAQAGGNAEGLEGNEVDVLSIIYSAGSATTSYTAATNTLQVSLTQADGVADLDDLIAAINSGSDFFATLGTADGTALVESFDQAGAVFLLDGGQDALSDTLVITTADFTNDFNDTTVTIESDTAVAPDSAVAIYISSTDTIEVLYNGNITLSAIATEIARLDDFTAWFTTGTAVLNSHADNADFSAVINTTAGDPGGLSEDVIFRLAGLSGSEIFTLPAGTSIYQVADQINLVQNATGVTATVNGTTLELRSVDYGANSFVDLRVISEAHGTVPQGTFTDAVGAGVRNTGNDFALAFSLI